MNPEYFHRLKIEKKNDVKQKTTFEEFNNYTAKSPEKVNPTARHIRRPNHFEIPLPNKRHPYLAFHPFQRQFPAALLTTTKGFLFI